MKLKQVGSFTPEKTGTPNHLLFIGSALITGGAVSPDGSKAVIRTMSDAYEFDVSNGDVAAAVTSGKYRITPLPNEPQGEGISYTPDGKTFVTCSDQNGPSTLLRYAPAKANSGKAAAGAQVPSPQADTRSFISKLTLQDITYIVVGVGVLGLILVIGGILGIRNSRKRRRSLPPPVRGSAAIDGRDAINSFEPFDGPGGPGGPGGAGGQGRRGGPGGPGTGSGRGGDPGGTVYGRSPGDEGGGDPGGGPGGARWRARWRARVAGPVAGPVAGLGWPGRSRFRRLRRRSRRSRPTIRGTKWRRLRRWHRLRRRWRGALQPAVRSWL